MAKIYNFEEFKLNESSLDEGLFSGIKRRRALGEVSGAAQQLYDAIVKKYDIDIESVAFKESKEWYELSRAARSKKSEAYSQRLRAAAELITELTDKCNNLINSRRDDAKFYDSAVAIVNDAQSRARKEVMQRAEKEISKKSIEDFRTDFDDWADDEFGIFRTSGSTKKKSGTKSAKDVEMEQWKKNHAGFVKVVPGKVKEIETMEWEEIPDSDTGASDNPDLVCVAPDGHYYAKPKKEFKGTSKFNRIVGK